MYHDKMVGALEAVLFAAGEPLSVAELAQCLQLDKPQVWELLSSLEHCYEEEGRGLMLRQIGEGYQLVTKPEHYALVSNLSRKKEVKLTNAAMETLAIIAFKQPITRAEMEAIRGVKVDGVVNTLLDLGLIGELIAATVPATEHSVMCAGGEEDELGTFRGIRSKACRKGIFY